MPPKVGEKRGRLILEADPLAQAAPKRPPVKPNTVSPQPQSQQELHEQLRQKFERPRPVVVPKNKVLQDPTLVSVTKAAKGCSLRKLNFSFDNTKFQWQSASSDIAAKLMEAQSEVANISEDATNSILKDQQAAGESIVLEWKGNRPICGAMEPNPKSCGSRNVVSDLFASVPDLEWWDQDVVKGPMYTFGLKEEAISDLIWHPLLIEGTNKVEYAEPRALEKTQQEQRKERHVNRVKAQQEKQELMKQGLLAKPQDKLRLRNLQTNLLAQSLLNPTEVETDVRAQIQKRFEDHMQRNQERHLAAADHQRDHAVATKIRYASTDPHIAVFRVLGVTSEHRVTKLKLNCNDRLLRGHILWIQRKFLIAVLVGGAHAIADIKNFVERREPWDPGSVAELVWQGPISKECFENRYWSEFSQFSLKGEEERSITTQKNSTLVMPCDSSVKAMEYLEKVGLGHTWDVSVWAPC